jgi:hypothetical protein
MTSLVGRGHLLGREFGTMLGDDSQRDDAPPPGETAPSQPVPPWLVRFRREQGRRLGSWQFRLSHVVWLTIAVSILSTLGSHFGFDFVLGALVVLYVFAPTTAVTVACMWPAADAASRRVIGVAAFVLLLIAAVGAAIYQYAHTRHLGEHIAGLFVCGPVLWVPQGLVVWVAISGGGFRKASRTRKR